jgi:hypothetical protein
MSNYAIAVVRQFRRRKSLVRTLVLLVRCRARCQRKTYFAARVGFCAASFLNFDFPRDFAGCSVPVLSAKKPLFFQGFSHIGQLLWLSCLSMHVHACRCCPCRNHRLVRCLGPQKHFSESRE